MPPDQNGVGLAGVNLFGRQHAETGMTMFVVVPRKEELAVSPRIEQAAEAIREVRPILEGANIRAAE